jgi:hypothetical protein
LISFIAIAFIAAVAALLIYMKLSAGKARKISDEMMEKYKTVDKDIQNSTDELDSLNKMYYDSLRNANK